MSHANATFVFADGSRLFGEYDGTSDVMNPLMFVNAQDRLEQWRKQVWKDCDCGAAAEKCIAHTDYGGGFWWHGTACRKCGVFIGPKMPWDDGTDITHGKDAPEKALVG